MGGRFKLVTNKNFKGVVSLTDHSLTTTMVRWVRFTRVSNSIISERANFAESNGCLFKHSLQMISVAQNVNLKY